MHNTDYRRIKRSSIHLTSNQAIKVNFRRSKILIPVANGSTGLVSVTTPCRVTHSPQALIYLNIISIRFSACAESVTPATR